jgi:hypothetical protein
MKCQIFGPQWKFFAQHAIKQESKTQIAKINLLENVNTARRFRIIIFPTILYLKEGNYYNYTLGQS